MSNIEALFETPSIGGVVGCTVIVLLVSTYALTVRWISKGQEKTPERED